AGLDPGRGDLEPRFGIGGGDPAGDGAADERAHLERDRAPAVDGAQPRSHPGVRPRQDRRAAHPRRAGPARGRNLSRAVRAAGDGIRCDFSGGVSRSPAPVRPEPGFLCYLLLTPAVPEYISGTAMGRCVMRWFQKPRQPDIWEVADARPLGDIEAAQRIREICAAAGAIAERMTAAGGRKAETDKAAAAERYEAAIKRALEIAMKISDDSMRDVS